MNNLRKERIERLLKELAQEVEMGVLREEIDELLTFNYLVPFSKNILGGVVKISFSTKPVSRALAYYE